MTPPKPRKPRKPAATTGPTAVADLPVDPATAPTFGVKGQKLWDDITAQYDLRLDELRVLEDACREADLIERMQVELDNPLTELIVLGSMKQPVASPLVQEIRQHRTVLARHLGLLKLPDEDGDTAGERSAHGRDLAAARWGSGS